MLQVRAFFDDLVNFSEKKIESLLKFHKRIALGKKVPIKFWNTSVSGNFRTRLGGVLRSPGVLVFTQNE